MIKPLPPYAKTARIVAGTLWIRCGQRGWDFMKAHPSNGELVFPATLSARTYTWPVQDLEVWVVGESGDLDLIAELCTTLLQEGAKRVHLIDGRFKSNTSNPRHTTLSFDELRRAG